MIRERRAGVFEPPSIIAAETLRTNPTWRVERRPGATDPAVDSGLV